MAAPVSEVERCVHPTKAQVAKEIAHPEKGLTEITFPDDVRGLNPAISTEADMGASLLSKIQPFQPFSTKF